MQQQDTTHRINRIKLQRDIVDIGQKLDKVKKEEQDLKAISRALRSGTPAPQKFYTFNAGVFVKNDGKQYYKTIESNLGDLAKLKKQYNTDLQHKLESLIKVAKKDEYHFINPVVLRQLQLYQQRIEDKLDLDN